MSSRKAVLIVAFLFIFLLLARSQGLAQETFWPLSEEGQPPALAFHSLLQRPQSVPGGRPSKPGYQPSQPGPRRCPPHFPDWMKWFYCQEGDWRPPTPVPSMPTPTLVPTPLPVAPETPSCPPRICSADLSTDKRVSPEVPEPVFREREREGASTFGLVPAPPLYDLYLWTDVPWGREVPLESQVRVFIYNSSGNWAYVELWHWQPQSPATLLWQGWVDPWGIVTQTFWTVPPPGKEILTVWDPYTGAWDQTYFTTYDPRPWPPWRPWPPRPAWPPWRP